MSIDYKGLINNSLVDHTKASISYGENLTYYIDSSAGLYNLDRYPVIPYGIIKSEDIQINNLGHSQSESNFIRETLNKLDKIIDLDFTEKTDNDGSHLDFYHVIYSSSFETNAVGQALSQRSQAGSWWEILWKNSNLEGSININSDKNTIIHEIGHSLGLSHPFNDPTSELWNTDDTVMSYNNGENGWSDWYSEADINALIAIWGRENDLGIINFEKNSFDYKYKKNSNESYSILTDIGAEDITDIRTLEFMDKSINVKKDIIGVFDLIKEIDDITGKIYRLYNAAFGRFPDYKGLKYWINSNETGRDTFRATASSFIISDEYINKYGKDSSDKEYVNLLYKHILNRPADTSGFNYWFNQIDQGYENRSELLIGFSESLENKTIFSNETSIF